jgi:hypothetical protein
VRALADLGALGAAVPGARSGGDPERSGDLASPGTFGGEPGVWVVCELRDGSPNRVSLELLSKATELAPALGGGVGAVVAGARLGLAVDDVTRHGADVVYVADDDALSPYRVEPHARVIARLAEAHRPAAVLFGATTTGRDLAPRDAAMLDTGLAADCTDLVVAPWERRGRPLRRPPPPDPAGHGGRCARHLRQPGSSPADGDGPRRRLRRARRPTVQSRTTVHPRLYVACGISGALQHTVGMCMARTVLAINRDPEAFIFRLAHFGIVADVRDALPELSAAVRRSATAAE